MSRQGPCPSCGSSDANTDYGTHYYCFSCTRKVNKTLDNRPRTWQYKNEGDREEEVLPYQKDNIKPNYSHRGLTKETLDAYGCFVSGERVYQPYGDKVFNTVDPREPDKKKRYRIEGELKQARLFGQDRFTPGCADSITVYEAAYDAMSGYQMMGSKYPNVACRSASTAEKECKIAFEYLNSFNRIVLCFDSDRAGKDAALSVARLFSPGRVFNMDLGGTKDANELLEKGQAALFNKLWWNAKKYKHDKIISGYDEILSVLSSKDKAATASYPFQTLQDMTFGIREGEVILITAKEKIGKTEVIGAIEYHLLKTTDKNIGIIHLEEGPKRVAQRLLTYELKHPVHLPSNEISLDKQMETYKTVTTRDDRVHIYSHFGSDDPDAILDAVRYLASACDCKFIFFDHITMIVTGSKEEDERKTLDYISTRLAMLVRELGVTLFMVSHVNDYGETRGSRNIAKVADLIVSIDRDKENPDADIRNTTSLMVRGNRFAAVSGPAGELIFDTKTYTLSEKKEASSEAEGYNEDVEGVPTFPPLSKIKEYATALDDVSSIDPGSPKKSPL